MPSEILIDVSEMEAPLPLQLSLEKASQLEQHNYIKMIHRMKPCHLFGFLEKLGVWWLDFQHSDNQYLVFMALENDNETIEYLKGKIADEYDRIIS